MTDQSLSARIAATPAAISRLSPDSIFGRTAQRLARITEVALSALIALDERYRQRRAFARLDDWLLDDIGLTRERKHTEKSD